MTTNAPLSQAMLDDRCRRNSCTGADCECWLDDDEAEDAKLITAAFGRSDVQPRAYTIEYIDDARMLTVLGPGGAAVRRLYLDEPTGQIKSVPLDVEYVVDARDLLEGAVDRHRAHSQRTEQAPKFGE